jgi:hypothetical protein
MLVRKVVAVLKVFSTLSIIDTTETLRKATSAKRCKLCTSAPFHEDLGFPRHTSQIPGGQGSHRFLMQLLTGINSRINWLSNQLRNLLPSYLSDQIAFWMDKTGSSVWWRTEFWLYPVSSRISSNSLVLIVSFPQIGMCMSFVFQSTCILCVSASRVL